MSLKQRLTKMLGLVAQPTRANDNLNSSCPKCGKTIARLEQGFLPKSLLVMAYIIGVGSIITYMGGIISGDISAPTGAGGGKFIVFFPVVIGYLILKIQKNTRKEIFVCNDCENTL